MLSKTSGDVNVLYWLSKMVQQLIEKEKSAYDNKQDKENDAKKNIGFKDQELVFILFFFQLN